MNLNMNMEVSFLWGEQSELWSSKLKLLSVFVIHCEFWEGQIVFNADEMTELDKVEQLDYTDYKRAQDIIIE